MSGDETSDGSRLLGGSEAMRALRGELLRVAPLDATVLVTGETGVGKGLAARELHRLSGRAREPFVHVDCASVAPGLVESELFGHERGAFTGAVAPRAGRFERAGRGTLFLDEIGELGPALQGKLLRVLQEREFERLGGSRSRAFEARIVAATNRDLAAEVRAGRFRVDLYYRLDVLGLWIPPLRRRPGDVAPLFHAIAARLARARDLPAPRLTREAARRLEDHPWPGNVRELGNVVERVLARPGASLVSRADAERVLAPRPELPVTGSWSFVRIRDAADPAHHIADALAATGGNVAGAARRLGMPRSTLRRRMKRHGVDRNGSSARRPQQHEAFAHDQPQRDEGENGLVEPDEPDLVDAVEQLAAHPGSRDHHHAEDDEQRRVSAEGETGAAEHDDLRQVPQALGHRLGPDDALPREADVQEERREQRTGGSDGHVERSHDTAENDEASVGIELLRMRAQEEQPR
jgi:transcriptional regulator with AAA-type ATPase domain